LRREIAAAGPHVVDRGYRRTASPLHDIARLGVGARAALFVGRGEQTMKKIAGRKLALARETLLPLQPDLLDEVNGGQSILPRSELCITDQLTKTLTQTVRTLTKTIETLRPTRPMVTGGGDR